MAHVLNRKVPAPLPAHRMVSRVAPVIQPVVDLRTWDGPNKNQLTEGCCTGETGTSILEWIARRYFRQWAAPVFSPQYVYAKELIAQGSFPQDAGSDGVTLCNVLIASGACLESVYPFVDGDIEKPTTAQDEDAAKYRLGAYHGLTSSQVALTVLGDPVPWPIAMGFEVAESLESPEVAQTGVYLPKPNERIIGGHEIKASGYDIGDLPTLRPVGCPPAFLFQNSWGTDWGWQGGYVWIPLSVLDSDSTDLKIVHSGAKWV